MSIEHVVYAHNSARHFTGHRNGLTLNGGPDRVEEVDLDTVLAALPRSAARMVRAAHAAGHTWVARRTAPVPAGETRWGHQVPDTKVSLPRTDQVEWDGDCAWEWHRGRQVRRISFQAPFQASLERLRSQAAAS